MLELIAHLRQGVIVRTLMTCVANAVFPPFQSVIESDLEFVATHHPIEMKTPSRLANLDALRGLAALLVVWQHTSELFVTMPHLSHASHWLADIAWGVDFGRIGVVCFFLISGFVIPFSLKPAHPEPLRTFVRRRFYRLYPAYWVSIVLAVLLSGWAMQVPNDAATVASNFTMLQSFLGEPHVLGLYWTLQVELVFYLLCAGLFYLERLHSTRMLFSMVVALFGVFVAQQVMKLYSNWLDETNKELLYMPYYLSIMFLGTLYRKWYDTPYPGGQLKLAVYGATGLCLGLPVLALILASLGLDMASHPHPIRFGAGHALAFVLFALGITWRFSVPRAAVWLGTISYSLYLFHPIAMNLVYYGSSTTIWPWDNLSLGSTMLIATGLSIAMAATVYYVVEKPAIRRSHAN